MTQTLDRPISADTISDLNLESMLTDSDIPCECPGDNHEPDGCANPAKFKVSIECECGTCGAPPWLTLLCQKCTNDVVMELGVERVTVRPL